MATRTKAPKRVVGDIVKIPLGDGWHSYARVLPEASYAFYDTRVNGDDTFEEIIARPILFFAAVMGYAIKKSRWPIVGHVPSEDQLKAPPRFIQDALNKDRFEVYEDGKIRPSTRAECAGLECAAVWDPEHVEDRLRDHYAGRKNKWVESLKVTD